MTVEVPEAPVFRPTAQEFADPLSYISSIQATAAAAGIAKIVPPPGTWTLAVLVLHTEQNPDYKIMGGPWS